MLQYAAPLHDAPHRTSAQRIASQRNATLRVAAQRNATSLSPNAKYVVKYKPIK